MPALAVSFAHRLNLSVPIVVQAGYANGGGSEHVGRGAISFVW